MSRTFFPLDWKEKVFPCLLAPPVCEARRWAVPWILHGSISVASLLSSDDVDRVSGAGKPWRLPDWQHIDLSEARGLVLFRVVREGIGITRRLSARWVTSRLQAIRILTLEPERLKNRSATPRGKITGDGKGSSPRRSSGLRVQFIDVEVFSLLPQCQRNGCNLACQGEAHHGGLDAFGQRALVKILEWSGEHTGAGGSAFEQTFQIMVVILVQAANRRLFLAPPHLPVDVVIFAAVAGFQPQSAVGPQLALAAKTMGRLNQRHR